MGASVTAVLETHRHAMRPGDSFLVNSPYHGGTHLPDMTVVTPVFDAAGSRIDFITASRAHHADIGGIDAGLDAARQPRHRRRGRAVRAGTDRPRRAPRRRPAGAGLRCRRVAGTQPRAEPRGPQGAARRQRPRHTRTRARRGRTRPRDAARLHGARAATTRKRACAARSGDCGTAGSATNSTTDSASRWPCPWTTQPARRSWISRGRRRSRTTTSTRRARSRSRPCCTSSAR